MESRDPIKDEAMIQEEFEALLKDYSETPHNQKIELITKAFHFAYQAHKGVFRKSGEPYILHPLAVARITVKEIGLGSTSICAALLHDVVEDTEYTVEDIKNLFGEKIANIVAGLTKISSSHFAQGISAQAENFRKLLITLADDARVVLIKLADRLHNMRTLEFQPLETQQKIAGETQYIYAPLAHRLGLFAIKTELENLSFKYEHPDTYKEIADKLAANKDATMAFFEEFKKPIEEKLKQMGYDFVITARIKSVYSIWNKMQAKSIPFEDVYDTLAVRIIFQHDANSPISEKNQCWSIYGCVTDCYMPHPERIRDWVSTPKNNGYEALHVTVMTKQGQWVEVQIRSQRMHDIAEKGLAAHWKYKSGELEESQMDQWLKGIKESLANPDSTTATDFIETVRMDFYSSEMFVFTPKGEIKTLPKGATVLDFAFLLHTDLGIHCIGAKVNHQLQPISYNLKNGDLVSIETNEMQQPDEKWLTYTTTAKAQSRLKSYFKHQQREMVQKGEMIFAQLIIELGLQKKEDAALMRALNYFKLGKPQELLLQIGKETISHDELRKAMIPKSKGIMGFLKNPFSRNDDKTNAETGQTLETTDTPIVKLPKDKHIVLSDENADVYVLESCCCPLPGDDIVAIMDFKGLTHIHRPNCLEARRRKAEYGKRILTSEWKRNRIKTYPQYIRFLGLDRVGLLIEVLQIISNDMKLNIIDLHGKANNGLFEGQIQAMFHNVDELQELLKRIRKLPDMKTAERQNQIEGLDDIDELD
ncbi:MAG: bifunctional (p)ppGpp synthetase/guanosine-3',5'-bis(diphosphate) 3'-pyrophosphohydrolase [Paludibacteraceae bacterium]|nr:bifunctional (p)ppGpp synthetase/guanosine-3',5'-bis(diphosphate) 3'-pyrophosphohydrolase [Paludibacteraceae bacterium]